MTDAKKTLVARILAAILCIPVIALIVFFFMKQPLITASVICSIPLAFLLDWIWNHVDIHWWWEDD